MRHDLFEKLKTLTDHELREALKENNQFWQSSKPTEISPLLSELHTLTKVHSIGPVYMTLNGDIQGEMVSRFMKQ